MNWKEWFSLWGGTVEEDRYQATKQRLADEASIRVWPDIQDIDDEYCRRKNGICGCNELSCQRHQVAYQGAYPLDCRGVTGDIGKISTAKPTADDSGK
jgi:hypothetical protein